MVYLVEDDGNIRKLVEYALRKEGFQVEGFSAPDAFWAAMEQEIPQLLLLDIMLPFFNGFHWCQRIREFSKVPIIFLSSASDNMNIVMAMNMGADDFINKPFNFQVLIAKIQALLRRTYDYQISNDHLEYKGVLLDIGAAMLYFQDTKCELTKNEVRAYQGFDIRLGRRPLVAVLKDPTAIR